MGNLSSVRDRRRWNKAFFSFYLCIVHLTLGKRMKKPKWLHRRIF